MLLSFVACQTDCTLTQTATQMTHRTTRMRLTHRHKNRSSFIPFGEQDSAQFFLLTVEILVWFANMRPLTRLTRWSDWGFLDKATCTNTVWVCQMIVHVYVVFMYTGIWPECWLVPMGWTEPVFSLWSSADSCVPESGPPLPALITCTHTTHTKKKYKIYIFVSCADLPVWYWGWRCSSGYGVYGVEWRPSRSLAAVVSASHPELLSCVH